MGASRSRWGRKDLGTLQRGEAGGFRIPLVPADEHADRRVAGPPRLEAGVAGGKVELLVEERIVRDVHLPVNAEELAVGVNDRSGVVVEAGGALLEE